MVSSSRLLLMCGPHSCPLRFQRGLIATTNSERRVDATRPLVVVPIRFSRRRNTLFILLPLLILLTIAPLSASADYKQTVYILDGSNPIDLMQSVHDCATMGGSWLNATLTCLISGSGFFSGTLTIGKDATLVIGNGSTFSTGGGSITNHGSIRIINSTFGEGPFGGGQISNEGGGTIVNSGSLTGDEIYDYGGGVIINSGTITSNYFIQISANSSFNNTFGGTIINSFDRIIYNYGALYNGGTIINSGYINSNATITNTGTILNNGTINNEGGIVYNQNGSITNYCGNTINNSGQITGNPVMTTTSCSVATTTTATVPEFPIESLAIVAFAIMAIFATLTRRKSALPRARQNPFGQRY